MDNKTVEILAVDAVKDSITSTEYLDPIINENDKEPSWDGTVYIYNNKRKRKKDLIGRIPIQVKGKQHNDLNKREISFPVSIDDLDNYLHDGGAIFFVVYIDEENLCKQIYYSEFAPIKLKMVLESAKNQKTKNLMFKKFPNDSKEKRMIFLNCRNNFHRQASFSDVDLPSLEELEKQGILEDITIPVTTIDNISPTTALFKSDVYCYAKIKGQVVKQPISTVLGDIVTREEKSVRIEVNDRLFYNKVNIIKSKKGVKTVIGRSLEINFIDNETPVNIRYKNSKMLRVLAKDLDFMLSYIENGFFEYDGFKIAFDKDGADFSDFSISQEKETLLFAQKAVLALNQLGCNKDIDITQLQKKDINNLKVLINGLVDKKPVYNAKIDVPEVFTISVGDLFFVLYTQKVEGMDNAYRIFDFFQSEFDFWYEDSEGKKRYISQYASLHAEDMIKIDNIRYDVFLPSFQAKERHDKTIEIANLFLLELIKAYDLSGNNNEILKAAQSFSEWIFSAKDEELPYEIRLLNKLQIVKRIREYNADELLELKTIVKNTDMSDELLVGAYILLDNQELANIHFNNLGEEQQKAFREYPIYRFLKQ